MTDYSNLNLLPTPEMEKYLAQEVLNREQLETKKGKCLPQSRYPVNVFEFITNLTCKRDCAECVRKPLHSLLLDYECKVEEIQTFVELAEMHHRIFPAIRLSGGDALLWSGLDEAIEILKKTPIVKKLEIMLSPVESDLDRLMQIAPAFDVMYLSRRADNGNVIDTMKKEFPRKIFGKDKYEHFVNPLQSIANCKPLMCDAAWATYFLGRVWACPNFCFIWFKAAHSLNLKEMEPFSISLSEEIASPTDWNIGCMNGICGLCMNNKSIRGKLEKVSA
jgi:hypothetical protein